MNLPGTLHLSPGQKITLSVHYPLSFHSGSSLTFQESLKLSAFDHLLTKELVLSPKSAERFEVQIRIFGRIPVKKLQVEVAEPPQLIPGGQAVGVLFSSKGVVIVGHLPIKGVDGKMYYPAKTAGLKVGDVLLAINSLPVNRVDDVEVLLRNFRPWYRTLNLTIKRGNQIRLIKVHPVLSYEEGTQHQRYMLGIFIEDPAAGVGTLTFYDPVTRKFAGLGHHIAEFSGAKGLTLQNGEIVLASINGIKAGLPGQPGEKIGVCSTNLSPIGLIEKNSRFGIYGTLTENFIDFTKARSLPMAYSSQITLGSAEIYTVIKERLVEKFQVQIIKVYRQDSPRDKGLILKVTDPELLKRTGGIIQGMSGSPIIQNGRLIGAVTHVFVNDPTKGYGVLAEWMIREINELDETAKRSKGEEGVKESNGLSGRGIARTPRSPVTTPIPKAS